MTLEGEAVDTDLCDPGRRDALKKAAVGGAILWAAPAIKSMPAAAQVPSGCEETEVDFGSGIWSGTEVGGVVITPSTAFDGGSTPLGDNLAVVTNQGGLAGSFVRLNQTAVANGGQTLTLNFSAPVSNVTFAITDIDNDTTTITDDSNNVTYIGWSDRVTINGSFSFSSSGDVIGVGGLGNGGGTQAPDTGGDDPGSGAFRSSGVSNVPVTSPLGNVFLTFAGPLTSISLRFWCGDRSGLTEQISIGGLRFWPCEELPEDD